MALPDYEIFALRYARLEARTRRDNFIAHDPHDDPMPMDYFIWLIRSADRTILVDTGFNARQAGERGRTLLRCPIGALSHLGRNIGWFELCGEPRDDFRNRRARRGGRRV